jgi:Endonuclease/Exonuclease/phosphatase family
MHIISWNLNHRTLPKPIPKDALSFFQAFRPDLIALNEFVDAPSRADFKHQLAELGYRHQFVSVTRGKHNQVFVASRLEIELGDIAAPSFDDSSRSNFLHVREPSSGVEVVAFRAPAYTAKSDRDTYWAQLRGVMQSAHARPICFIGDANYDPFVGASADSRMVSFDIGGSYFVPRPAGDWSYVSIDGTRRTRIDHAFLTPSLSATQTEYVTDFAGFVLAGSGKTGAVSDHAVLSIRVHRRN